MSLFAELTSAATQAQGIFAEMQGMSAGGTNFLVNGFKGVGVWGASRVEEPINAGGGYKRKTWATLVATRSQFSIPLPASKQAILRTDIAPQCHYTVDSVNTDDPIFVTFVVWKSGGPS